MEESKELDTNLKTALMKKSKEKNPFWRLIGMDLVDVKKGWAKMKLPFDKKLTHALGIAHGGTIFSLADTAVALALLGIVGRNETFTTIEMKINFVRPFEKGEIEAEAKIISRTRNTAVGEAEVRDNYGNLIAKALTTYMIRSKGNGF